MPQLATLYIPAGLDLDRWLATLAAVADAAGWQVNSLVRRWDDMVDLLASRHADIGIIPSRDLLEPGRTPRLVAADTYRPPTPGPRRPRWR